MVSFCTGIETEDVAIYLHFVVNFFGLLVFFSQLLLADVHILANTYRNLRCTISNTLKTAPNDDSFAFCKIAQKKQNTR